jgi:hypothetical protein
MFKKTMLLAVFCLSSAMATESLYQTGGVYNGRGWLADTVMEKLNYIYGMSDVARNFKCESISDLWPGSEKATYMEIVQIVDQFYADASNRAVPVLYALGWVKMKLRGDTPAALEKFAASLRRTAVGLAK